MEDPCYEDQRDKKEEEKRNVGNNKITANKRIANGKRHCFTINSFASERRENIVDRLVTMHRRSCNKLGWIALNWASRESFFSASIDMRGILMLGSCIEFCCCGTNNRWATEHGLFIINSGLFILDRTYEFL